MSREPLETMPDVMDAKQLADVLRISKAGAYNPAEQPGFSHFADRRTEAGYEA